MPTAACGAVFLLVVGQLTCDLTTDHIAPTESEPQGSPHSDGSHVDILTGNPTRWWG